MKMRRTKILATLGPASNSEEKICELLNAGVNAFRLNFSHGSHEDHAATVERIRQAAADLGRYVPIVADIQGPKLRIGEVDGVQQVREGQTLEIEVGGPVIGSAQRVSTPFTPLPQEVRPGERILINDGLVELVVTSVDDDTVTTRVVHGGPISSRKGMNFPDSELTIPAITEKDREDVRFAVEHRLDYVAASFVRRKADIVGLRRMLREFGGAETHVIAKLEKPQAIDNLDEILEVSDGVMVARGDLGVELPPEAVPINQKKILARARRFGRFAITATQMLESMTTNSRPTRAEASDVANAIFDGSDAVMLSAETASGRYPVESVEMMARIISAAEEHRHLNAGWDREPFVQSQEVDAFTDALAASANLAAEQLDARFIVVFTMSGFSAQLMSKFRPKVPVIALTPSDLVARRVGLLWGVQSFILSQLGNYHEELIEMLTGFLRERALVQSGDRLVILMGSPVSEQAKTNLLRVHRVS